MVQHYWCTGLGWCTHWCHRLRRSGAERAASGTAATPRELLATWRFSSLTRSGFEKVVRFSFKKANICNSDMMQIILFLKKKYLFVYVCFQNM